MNDEFFWAWFAYVLALAMQGKHADAQAAARELRRVAPDFEPEDAERILRNYRGHPTGERSDIIDRQIDSLRAVWPT